MKRTMTRQQEADLMVTHWQNRAMELRAALEWLALEADARERSFNVTGFYSRECKDAVRAVLAKCSV